MKTSARHLSSLVTLRQSTSSWIAKPVDPVVLPLLKWPIVTRPTRQLRIWTVGISPVAISESMKLAPENRVAAAAVVAVVAVAAVVTVAAEEEEAEIGISALCPQEILGQFLGRASQ